MSPLIARLSLRRLARVLPVALAIVELRSSLFVRGAPIHSLGVGSVSGGPAGAIVAAVLILAVVALLRVSVRGLAGAAVAALAVEIARNGHVAAAPWTSHLVGPAIAVTLSAVLLLIASIQAIRAIGREVKALLARGPSAGDVCRGLLRWPLPDRSSRLNPLRAGWSDRGPPAATACAVARRPLPH